MKKKLYGNYLGLVISGADQDPENRGRCQIFFPGVSNTLYKKINKNLKDLSFGHIDPSVFTPDILKDLRDVLPWAECAAPITGGGTSGFYNPVTQSTAVGGFKDTIQPDTPPANIHENPDAPAWADINADPSNVEQPKQNFTKLNPSNTTPYFNISNQQLTVNVDSSTSNKYLNLSNTAQSQTSPIIKGQYIGSEYPGLVVPVDKTSTLGRLKNGDIVNVTLSKNNQTYTIALPVTDRGPNININKKIELSAGAYELLNQQGANFVLGKNSLSDSYGWNVQINPTGERLDTPEKIQAYKDSYKSIVQNGSSNQASNIASTDPKSVAPNPDPVDDTTPAAPAFAGYSGRPHGVFAFPRMGAKLWSFFYGGDIQRPVYFAAAYEPDSIRYAIGSSSPASKLREDIDAEAADQLPKDNTVSENRWGDLFNYSGATLDTSSETSGDKNNGIPFTKSSFNLYNLEGTGVSSEGGLWNIGNPANSGGSIRGSEEGININTTAGDIVLTADNIKLIGNVTVNSGTKQTDQKKSEEYLRKEQSAVDQIANQQANDIAQGGEEQPCPLCEQKLADDKSDFVARILRTIQKYSNILPWDCWNWGVTKFLINFIVTPMLSEISALAVSGGEGCGMCDKGKVKSYAQSIENANKKAADTFTQKQNEINESAKHHKPGSNVQSILGSWGISAGGGHMNNAKCSVELPHDCSCIATGLKKGTGAKANPQHQLGEKVKTVVHFQPNKTSAGDVFIESANDIKMIAGSPGISMETSGKISITGGFLDLNSTEGPAVLTSKNVTNVNGQKVHITGEKGIALTAPNVGINGNLGITGNLGVKGSITLDGALSVKHLKVKTMRSETTSNSSPKSTSNATTYYTGGAAGINIFDKVKNVLVRDNPLKMLMLTPKGLLTIFQEVYDRILLMIGIHPVPTGYFVGYGAGVVFNFTSNSSKVPDDHSHQFDAPQMTRAADNAAWVNMADDPSSEAPNPAPAQGDDPSGGPHSLAGCGGGGFGFSTGSNASRRRSARNSRYGVPSNSLNYGQITPQGYFNGVNITTNNTILTSVSADFITTTTDISGNVISITNSITGYGLDVNYDITPNSQIWNYDVNGEITPRDLVRFSISEDCL